MRALIPVAVVVMLFSPLAPAVIVVAQSAPDSPPVPLGGAPPAVWARDVVYPPGQVAAKVGDTVQFVATVMDNDTGMSGYWTNPPPVYMNFAQWGQAAQVRMYDDGKHMDGNANDSRYGSPPVGVTTKELCAWEGMPLIVRDSTGTALNTTITIAIDNLAPKYKKDAYAFYPPGQSAYKAGDDANFVALASDKCSRAIDVVFNTDDSGSMVWNDPTDLRVDAICRFATTFMETPDRGTGVYFYGGTAPELFPRDNRIVERHLHDTYPQICTDAQTAQSSGGTDGWPAFRLSLDELINFGDPNKIRMIIFLTDGEFNVGANNTGNTVQGPTGCIQQKIVTHTVLLDPPPINIALENQMKWIARQCGGTYAHAVNGSVLDPIFQQIGKNIKRLPVPYGIQSMWLDAQAIGNSRTWKMADDGVHDDGEQDDEIWGTGPVQVLAKTTGVFNVFSHARDIAHNESYKNITFRMDNTLPDVTAVTVTPARVRDGQSVTVGATVSDPQVNGVGGIEEVWVDARSIGGGDHVVMTCTGNTCTSPAIKVQTRGWIGDKRVNVIAKDVAFNNAADEGVLSVDNADPKVSPVGLQANLVISGEFLFAASAKDAVKVQMELVGNPGYTQKLLEYSKASKLWKVTVDTHDVPDGKYDVKFTAWDLYGDQDTSTVAGVKLDNSPPLVGFADYVHDGAYVDGSQLIYQMGNAKSVVKADDGVWTAEAGVAWRLDGSAWKWAQPPVKCPAVCTKVEKWDTHLAGPGMAQDGPHVLDAKIVDIVGREQIVSATLIVDNHAPSGKVFVSPDADAPMTGKARFGIDARDSVGLRSVEFRFTNKTNSSTSTFLDPTPDGYYWHEIDTSRLDREGLFWYQVIMTDVAEGTKLHDPGAGIPHVTTLPDPKDPKKMSTFVVDNTAPALNASQNIEVRGQSALTTSERNQLKYPVYFGMITFNATVIDGPGDGATEKQVAGVKMVEIRIDGGDWKPMPNINGTDKYTFKWDASKAENGPHLIEVRAFDNLDHMSQTSLTVYVDNPDFSSTIALVGMLVMVLAVVLPWIAIFHWQKKRAIGRTPPAGYKEYLMQSGGQMPAPAPDQQQQFAEGGNVRW